MKKLLKYLNPYNWHIHTFEDWQPYVVNHGSCMTVARCSCSTCGKASYRFESVNIPSLIAEGLNREAEVAKAALVVAKCLSLQTQRISL